MKRSYQHKEGNLKGFESKLAGAGRLFEMAMVAMVLGLPTLTLMAPMLAQLWRLGQKSTPTIFVDGGTQGLRAARDATDSISLEEFTTETPGPELIPAVVQPRPVARPVTHHTEAKKKVVAATKSPKKIAKQRTEKVAHNKKAKTKTIVATSKLVGKSKKVVERVMASPTSETSVSSIPNLSDNRPLPTGKKVSLDEPLTAGPMP